MVMNLPRVVSPLSKNANWANNSVSTACTVSRILHPIHVSLTLNLVPLSYASIKLSKDEKLPSRGFVELFTPYGSAGVFRVRSPKDAYGDEITTAELEHSIAEVGDYLVKEKIDKMVAADSAMKTIFKHYKGGIWQLGSVSALGKNKIALSVNYGRILDVMLSILEQVPTCMMSFDFTTNPWTVKFVKKGTDVSAEGRLSRNVTSAKVSYDDTELCTKVYYETFTKKNGEAKGTWKSKDASTKSKYGTVERTVTTSSDMSTDEINTVVDTYLSEHKKPRVAISIQGIELSQITGESMDKLALGKMYRLVIPEYDVVLEDNIVGLDWGDLYGKPTDIVVNVGDQEDTVVTFLHNLDSKGSGGGGGGGAKKEEEEKWKEYYTNFYQTDYMIGMNATRVNKANEILEKAGLDINSKGVLIYSEKPKDGLAAKFKVLSDEISSSVKSAKKELRSEIKQTADTISMVVSGTGKNAKIKPAAIQASINTATGKSKIKLSADNIELDGRVIGTYLKSGEITVHSLDILGGTQANAIDCGNIDCTYLNTNAGDIDCGGSIDCGENISCDGKISCDGNFTCKGDIKCEEDGKKIVGNITEFKTLKVYDGNTLRTASWKSKSIQTLTMSAFHEFQYDGGSIRGRVITDVSVATIYYLGRS